MDDRFKLLAAAAYRRAGHSFRDAASRVHMDKDRLRQLLTAEGRADGYGPDDPLRPDTSGHSISSFTKSARRR